MTVHDSNSSSELSEFRRQIDDIDDELIRLLTRRIGVVGQVGELKRRTAPGRCPIRPAREAEMVRRIMGKFAANPDAPQFPVTAAAALWRTLIGASTCTESPLVMSVFVSDRDKDLYWMTREYFGPSIQISTQSYAKRVIGDVMDGKASVGIVPMLRSSDTTYWWTNLTQQGQDMPKIFACLPFVYAESAAREMPQALAIARIEPEASGDDRTLLVLETDHNVSQHKLQTSFVSARLEATWINIATLNPAVRHHLIELKGFVSEGSEAIQHLYATLGNLLYSASFLGAYATPVILPNERPSHG